MRGPLAAFITLAIACGGPGVVAPRPAISPATTAAVERAESAEAARQHDQARIAFEQAVAEAPDAASEVYARRAFADTLLQWSELDAARAQLQAITAATPDDASAWHDLGIVASAQADDAGARAALTEARRLAPRDLRPRLALAALAWRTGDRAGARAEYEALLALDPPANLRAKIDWALKTLADPVAAPPPP